MSVEELKILLEYYKVAAAGSTKPLQRGKDRNERSPEESSSPGGNSVQDAIEHKPFLRAIERIVLRIFGETLKPF